MSTMAALPPTVIGGTLVVPHGLLDRLRDERVSPLNLFARETKRIEAEMARFGRPYALSYLSYLCFYALVRYDSSS